MITPSPDKSLDRRVGNREGRSPPPTSRPLSHDTPAAGAHAADHLINEDVTPGAGALPSYANRSGKEVDGGAG